MDLKTSSGIAEVGTEDSQDDFSYQPPTASALEPSATMRTSSEIQAFNIEQQHPPAVDTAAANNTANYSFVRDLFSPSLFRRNTNDTATNASPPNNQPPPSISQSFSTTRGSTYQVQRNRMYKGFSTPFCGLFATSGGLPTADDHHNEEDLSRDRREIQLSHLRSDLCSLHCFGVLQSDHTRYLFTHTRPPTFLKRSIIHFVLPFTVFLIAGWCSGNIRNRWVNSAVCTLLVYFICIWITKRCIRGRKRRVMVREEILWRLHRRDEKIKKRMEGQQRGLPLGSGTASSEGHITAVESEDYEYHSEDEYEYHKSGYGEILGQSRFEMNCATRICGCYPSDIPRESRRTSTEAEDYVLQ